MLELRGTFLDVFISEGLDGILGAKWGEIGAASV
jgi:hypothetical protein